jgi:hypothetical protein
LASATKVPPPSFQFYVTATRAADGSTSSPFYTTVPVTSKNSAAAC